MRISYKWLLEFLPGLNMPVGDAAHKLTMLGLEVEGVDAVGEDFVLEVNVTPNRADCLSVIGIARELSSVSGVKVKMPETAFNNVLHAELNVEISDSVLCRRYAGREIRGVAVLESPKWIKERLEKCGIRAINNIVDITNYVLLEFGHPLHAFDLDMLRGGIIRAGRAGDSSGITTLDGIKRKIDRDSLLIFDAEMPVAVAGVMGGLDTEVSDTTKNLFIESAWFMPDSVRKTSKALGLSTEASYRFERGTDIEGITMALDRAVHLIVNIAGGRPCECIDQYPGKFMPNQILLRTGVLNKVLGTGLETSEIINLLGTLGIGAVSVDDGLIEATQPSYRTDLQNEIDLIEEVARLYGYDKIESRHPLGTLKPGINNVPSALGRLSDAFRKEGFNDAVNYSFMDVRQLDALSLAGQDERRLCVEIRNPLRPEDSHLRTMLLPSLLENLHLNLSRGVRDVRLFEISRVFTAIKDALPIETLKAGGICYKGKARTFYKDPADDFYALKGAVQSALDFLNIEGYGFSNSDEPFLHPGKAADIYVSGKRAGWMGAVSPSVIDRLGIKAMKDVLAFELDCQTLISHSREILHFKPIPRFPSVERDIALILDESVSASDVLSLIRAFPSAIIEEAEVFDMYKGKNIPQGKKSLAFSIRFRSQEGTLTDEEVQRVHAGLLEYLIGKTGGSLRGA